MTVPAGQARLGGAPLRVSTLELFFDLVFAFTLTRLTDLLAHHLSPAGVAQLLLVFGVLWWMYGGYAWLTNTRAPDRPLERLLLLVGMAGFLVAGLAIPDGWDDTGSGLALGVGYLIVVVVHGFLYYRVNRHIVRVTPFNVISALLVILAGPVSGPAAYILWSAALAIQVLSPLIAHPSGRFEIGPAHFVERHGALVIVALGESVAAIGIGATPTGVTLGIIVAAVLGLALSACLWWLYFGDGDDERAERAMTAVAPAQRPQLALAAYFYAHIPMLLGVVALAAGVKLTLGNAAQPHPVGQAVAVAGGAALFLAGSAGFRRALAIGPLRFRLGAAVFALATTALGATVTIDAQLAVLLAGLVATLTAEQRWGRSLQGQRVRAAAATADSPPPPADA
jgi:low temperature requirement protein LtrA